MKVSPPPYLLAKYISSLFIARKYLADCNKGTLQDLNNHLCDNLNPQLPEKCDLMFSRKVLAAKDLITKKLDLSQVDASTLSFLK